jgi:hypothetical protein
VQLELTREAFEAELQGIFAKLELSGTIDDVRRVARVVDYLRSATEVLPRRIARAPRVEGATT